MSIETYLPSSGFGSTGEGAIEFWARSGGVAPDRDSVLVSTGVLSVNVTPAGLAYLSLQGLSSAPVVSVVGGGFRHVVVSIDERARVVTLWIGGDVAGALPILAPFNWTPGNENPRIALGQPMTWLDQRKSGFTGDVDEFAVYSRALVVSEVHSHMSAGGQTPPTVDPGTGLPPTASELVGANPALRNSLVCRRCHGDPVDVATGNWWFPLVPVEVAGRGPGLRVEATYNSLLAGRDSSVGFGGSSTLDMSVATSAGGKVATVTDEWGSTVSFEKTSGGGWAPPPRFVASLEAVSGGGYRFTRNRSEVFLFNGSGRLVSMSDRFGNTTSVHYPAGSAKADYLEDAGGRRLTITWSGNRVDTITDPLPAGEGGPRVADFGYDTAGNLTSYQDLSGGTWRFGYDGAHRLTTVRKPRAGVSGPAVESHYDAKGRVDWQKDELGRQTSFTYDTPAPGDRLVTLPGGRKVLHRYNGLRAEETIVGYGTAAATSTKTVLDPVTYGLDHVTDGAGKTTTFTDTNHDGNVDMVTDPTGRITRYTYNSFDQVTSVKVGETTSSTANIVTTTSEYDSTNGRLEKTTEAVGTSVQAVTDYVYGDASHPEDVTSIIDARNNTWQFTYGATTGYQESVEDPLGHTSTTAYNTIGWPTKVTSARGVATPAGGDFETTYAYDISNRTTTVTDPTGVKSRTTLDANGNTIKVATGITAAKPNGDETTYAYDDADELVTVDEPGPGARTYGYWPTGERKSFTTETGGVWAYAFDAAGRLVTETDPNLQVTNYGYNPAGRLATIRQPVAGASCTGTKVGCVTYSYDDAGRPTAVDYSDAATPDVTSISYDSLGRRTSATSAGATETWAWNPRSQLTSHTDANGDATGYGWDKTGNVTSITYPGKSTPVTRHFDAAGRLDWLEDFSGRHVGFDYDADNDWTTTTFPATSGTANTDQFGYDDAGRMTAATWRQGGTSGTVLGSEIYARTSASKGMVASTTPTGSAGSAAKTNVYDARDRLTAAGTESFGYDAASNVTQTADGRLQVFDPAQQLCWSSPTVAATAGCGTPPADATTFAYDTRGNQVRRRTADAAVRTNGYDQANRLVSVVDDSDPSPAPVADMTGRALVGNFDGDGEDDVFFYRPGGSNDDWVWWGTDRAQFSSATGQFSVSGEFRTATGDFNCDGRDDILWYRPGDGGVNDFVWFWFGRSGGGGNAGGGAYSSKGFDVDFDFTPFSGDFDADGCDDVFWYAPGSGVDAMWWGDEDVADPNTSFDLGGINVSGSYKPVVGNFDGDAADDVFWYGPGSTPDSLWTWGDGTRTYTATSFAVAGADFEPVAGDANGDGNDDLLWYSPGGSDALWWGNAPGLFGSGDQSSFTLGAGLTPVFGNFDGQGGDDLFLYKPTGSGDAIWWGASKATFGTAAGGVGFQVGPEHISTYRYDADGVRAAKTVDGVTTKFTYSTGSGLPLLLEQKTGSDRTYVIYGPDDRPVEQINADGTVAWLHHDQLGSVRLATKGTDGTETGRTTFTAYGSVAAKTGAQPLLGYAGQYADAESGYQYLRARYYDPTTSQFLTRDPIVAATGDPHGYANGNPSTYTDPTGLYWGQGVVEKAGHVGGEIVNGAAKAGNYAVEHRGALANIAAGAVCVGTAGTGCLLAATLAAGVNAQQTAQDGGSVGAVAISALKSYAVAIPGFAEFEAEATEGEALAMMARFSISTEGWAAPAWLTYGSRLFYQGAITAPDLMEISGSLTGGGYC